MPEKTHLLHLNPLAAIGGCEVNCLRVIKGLPECRHSVLVFGGPGPFSEKWQAAGATVVHLGEWENGRGPFRSALARWAATAERPTGIYYWSTSRLPLVLEVLKRWEIPWVVHLGNPIGTKTVFQTRLLLDQLASAQPRNITLVACSQQVAGSHRNAFYFRRFPTDVIYNPVDAEFYRARVHRSLPLGSQPRVGMVARLDVIKDHLTVIRALAEIAPIRNDIVLELAGEGRLRESLGREAARLGVGDRVHFLGAVSDVAGLLASWDIYVHSTTTAEGMGTAVAEAMSSGLPCLVSDLPVLREVCGDQGAIFAAAGDCKGWGRALLELISNRAQREACGSVTQERARSLFALPSVARRYLRMVVPADGGNAS